MKPDSETARSAGPPAGEAAGSGADPERSRAGWRWRRAGFLSPTDLIVRAIVLSALFGLAHWAGLREHTTLLSGTLADPTMRWEWAAFLGCTYLVLYFAFVLLVPILLLAAAASAAVHRLLGRTPREGTRTRC
jgi:hypothetical protein